MRISAVWSFFISALASSAHKKNTSTNVETNNGVEEIAIYEWGGLHCQDHLNVVE